MQLEGIDHIAMGVRDIERSANWYIDVLGFERLHHGMWNGVPTFIGKGTTGIALFPATEEPKKSAHREIRMLHNVRRELARRSDHFIIVERSHDRSRKSLIFLRQEQPARDLSPLSPIALASISPKTIEKRK